MTAATGPLRLGVIADDYTGGTDVASALTRVGARVRLSFGAPQSLIAPGAADALVVALKTRHAPVERAVAESVMAATWLRRQGASRLYLKVCSTFDSTDEGNIGPVADALLDVVGGTVEIVAPASPEHGRTVYQGHLFVGSRLLSESPMRHHPLTPMNESDLVRILSPQTSRVVRLLPREIVSRGAAATTASVASAAADGVTHLIGDAIDDEDLRALAGVALDLPLTTGGAGLARLIAHVALGRRSPVERWEGLPDGPTVILAGSLSARTGEQVEAAAAAFPSFHLQRPEDVAGASEWLDEHMGTMPVLIHSWVAPENRSLGIPAFEASMARLARRAVERGARRIIVAGGETSGAVVEGLHVQGAEVLAEEDRGVPWLVSDADHRVALLLKSGNFGSRDMLVRAAHR